jgi:biotin synthase
VLEEITRKIIEGESITPEESEEIISTTPIHVLFNLATTLREHFRGKRVDLCSIVNAKSGACPEDCSYCAQSARHKTELKQYPLLPKEEILEHAKKALDSGAKRFCIVTSGKKVNREELKRIAEAISEIRVMGLLPCATLGLLDEEELILLKEAGLYRYHHNIETSKRFFSNICTTHTYEEKVRTIKAAKRVGLSTCSGGIFGLGEDWSDRVEMAFTLRQLGVDSVPLNFLIPIKGTPLEDMEPLHPFEALRIVSLFRIVMPEREIRICGGRLQTLGHFNSMAFLAGADGLLIGNYLTQKGCSVEDDLEIIRVYGLQPA